jgi:hypothetical protein
VKVFWNDRGRGVASDSPIDVDIDKANDIWVDEVFGVKGNFYGLVDEDDRTMQFYFAEDIPDHVGDARHLKIVDIDFPCPEKGGSYTKRITIGEVAAYIEKAFTLGANPKGYDVEFISW